MSSVTPATAGSVAPRVDFAPAVPGLAICPTDELDFRINPRFGICTIRGTRAQIEDERVLPKGIDFPAGLADAIWESGPLSFRLVRIKPLGAKGRRELFSDADYWAVSCELVKPVNYRTRLIAEKQKELEQEIYRHSPQGEAEHTRLFLACEKAAGDPAFQHFKTLIPGLVKPKRSRRSNSDEQSQEVSA